MDSYRIFHADTHLRTPNSSFWTRKTSNSMKITELGNSELGRRGPELGRRGTELGRRGPELVRRGRRKWWQRVQLGPPFHTCREPG